MTTFVVQTHNLWGDAWQQERAGALRALYEVRPPDLLATQELRGWSRDALDETMAHHARVVDEFAGWERQSNLWWDSRLFEEVEHGAEDVGILDENARLFWVRLRVKRGGATLILSTAHLTWPGHAVEQGDGVNLRVPQAQRIVTCLDAIGDEGEAVFFTVDINDIAGPLWAFGNAGFLDSFSALGRHSPVTHPVIPSGFSDGVGTRLSPLASPAKAIDWVYARGPVRPRASEVVEFFHRGVAPSDHYPVAATFTLDDGQF
ncbi:hypothetical protein [Microbacterium sp. OR16]|uniref:hypothetical protein n=1 Tax=Microbacterium sp. OR16 TaxID=3095345 RepID=UPI0039B5E9DE